MENYNTIYPLVFIKIMMIYHTQPSRITENKHLDILTAQMERLVSAGNVAGNLFQSPETTKKVLFETRALWQIIINNGLVSFMYGSQVIVPIDLMKRFRHLIAIEQSFQKPRLIGSKFIQWERWTRNSSREWIAKIITIIDTVVSDTVKMLLALDESNNLLQFIQAWGGWMLSVENQTSGNGGGVGGNGIFESQYEPQKWIKLRRPAIKVSTSLAK